MQVHLSPGLCWAIPPSIAHACAIDKPYSKLGTCWVPQPNYQGWLRPSPHYAWGDWRWSRQLSELHIQLAPISCWNQRGCTSSHLPLGCLPSSKSTNISPWPEDMVHIYDQVHTRCIRNHSTASLSPATVWGELLPTAATIVLCRHVIVSWSTLCCAVGSLCSFTNIVSQHHSVDSIVYPSSNIVFIVNDCQLV